MSDAELAEMAELCEDEDRRYEIGVLSKQAEAWVLVSLAREGEGLKGFAFCTLERIGGTPSVLIGLASVQRCAERSAILSSLVADQLRRAVLAFPDEDVLVATRMGDPAAFLAYQELHDIVPRPNHRASGEERAWGRRLAKRFGVESSNYEDRRFIARGDGAVPCVLDYEADGGEDIDDEVKALFAELDAANGDMLVSFGWAMAEDLEKYA
ncbi:MAG: hypothetical protein S0880_25390 [Actinomycetota bacterium]|nr:hypothetical protein [Actinomycetota bacterium]